MPPAVRLADICTGHGCFPSRPNCQGSPNVFINSRAAHRKGDLYCAHCCGPACHGSTACAGSPNVFTNSKDQERVGDPVCCGSAMATGSPNVIVN